MQQLEEIVNYYLTSDTNYALMITGEWGVGKTYYYKNILKEKIKKTPTSKDQSKNYKPLLVSLFGLKSIEEIQTEIFLCLYPILKNKSVKLGANIGKFLIKGILQLNKLGEYYDYVNNVDVSKEDWIKFSELVICFDDLERLSDNLNIEEFIGYVNSLVENENVKVLIIANENKIEQKQYLVVKEKVIGNSIEFIPNISQSFDSLIEIKFVGFPHYKNFLTKNKNLVLDIYTKHSSNLRILSFALTYYQTVFSELDTQISSHKILNDKKEEISQTLLKFSLIISIEYKEGRISFRNKNQLYVGDPDLSWFSFNQIQLQNTRKEKNEDEKTYREKFIEKYYPDNSIPFTFFPSVFNFITGGSVFLFKELVLELNRFYHIQKNEVLIHDQILSHLSYPKVFSLTDKDYRKLSQQMLKYSDQGTYYITNYLTVFYFLVRFGNPFKFNLDKLAKRIIAGMKKGKLNYKFHESLGLYLNVDDNSENKEQLLRIREAALKINEEIDSNNKQIDSKRLETKCYSNFQEFCSEVLNPTSKYSFVAIFKNFSVHKFYRSFIASNEETKWQITLFWSTRYNEPYNELKHDIIFLEEFKNKLEKKLNGLPKSGLSNFVYQEHIKTLQKSIDKLSNIN